MSSSRQRKGILFDENLPPRIARGLNLLVDEDYIRIRTAKEKSLVGKSDREHIEWCSKNNYVFVSLDHSWLLDVDTPLWLPSIRVPVAIISDRIKNDSAIEQCIFFLRAYVRLKRLFDCDSKIKVCRFQKDTAIDEQTVEEAIVHVQNLKRTKNHSNFKDRRKLERLANESKLE